jgi:hypothetical protein
MFCQPQPNSLQAGAKSLATALHSPQTAVQMSPVVMCATPPPQQSAADAQKASSFTLSAKSRPCAERTWTRRRDSLSCRKTPARMKSSAATSSKAWPSPSAAYFLVATRPRVHHNDPTQMRKKPPKHEEKQKFSVQEGAALTICRAALGNNGTTSTLNLHFAYLAWRYHGGNDSPFCFSFFLLRGHLEANPSTKRSSTGVKPFFLDTWTLFDSWDIPLTLYHCFRSPNGLDALFSLSIDIFRTQCLLPSLWERNTFWDLFCFSLTGNEVMGWFHGIPQHRCCVGEGKEDTFFGLSCKCGIPQAWAGIWRAHSLLICALMMNARKETNDGRRILLFPFCLLFFF